jgi:hypothetical protein
MIAFALTFAFGLAIGYGLGLMDFSRIAERERSQ